MMITFGEWEQALQLRKQGWEQKRAGGTQNVRGWTELPVDCADLCPHDGEGKEKDRMVLFDSISQKDKTKL
jgi:hypothetical protein